ncbi:MAG: hypothetical protein QNK37_23250 [Acidobacteriota bacterium]|nr:hypothetical protein [Acidobacteriota bacterium]
MPTRTTGTLGLGLTTPSLTPSTSLTLAELSLQRGEYERCRVLLERRIARGAADFKTLNLYGICLSHGRLFDNAATIFQRLKGTRLSKSHRTKAVFNLGLTRFYQDLAQLGDLSVSSHIGPEPARLPIPTSASAHPFARAVEVWSNLKTNTDHKEIVNTYLSFAYLQQGKLDQALETLVDALEDHENFPVAHYVIGRVFMDLYHLALEGNDYGFQHRIRVFFDIEKYEVVRKVAKRYVVHPDTLLDIAVQAFIEGRDLSPLSVEMYLGLCRGYMQAGLFEEAQEALSQAESMAPSSHTILETQLNFHETVQSNPAFVQSLVNRLKNAKRKHADQDLYLIIPSYYLF